MFKLINKLFKKGDSHEFKPLLAEIEDQPANPLGRCTFWIIIAIMVFTIAWLFLGKVDVVVSARGQVIPDGHVKTIQPLNTGIIKRILVKEGDKVKKGQVLMEVDPSSINPELASMKKNLKVFDIEVKRINALIKRNPFNPESNFDPNTIQTQKSLYKATLNSLNKQLEKQYNELKQTEEELHASLIEQNKNSSLLLIAKEKEVRYSAVLDIIPKMEYQKVKSQIIEYENNLQKLDRKLAQLNHQKEKILQEISFIKEDFKVKLLSELSQKQKQITEQKAKIEEIEFTSTKQTLLSPVDGYVDFLAVHTTGGVVTPAQELMKITPQNAPLTIKATLLNKDRGFVEAGMPVQIKIDTFNFQKYGMLEGEVLRISKDSKQDEKIGPIFEAYILPKQHKLRVESREVSISSGMSVSAEIKVGKRRIIEFFIYPLIKYWNESISIR